MNSQARAPTPEPDSGHPHHLANHLLVLRDVVPPELRVRAPVQPNVSALRPRESTLRRNLIVRGTARRDIGAHIERRAHRRCAARRMVDHRSGPRHICPITLFFPGNAATRILEHETTFRLAMVTAPMRRLPIPLLMSKGYGESATAARCQSPSRIRK